MFVILIASNVLSANVMAFETVMFRHPILQIHTNLVASSQHLSISFQIAGIITCLDNLVGRALEINSRGHGFGPRSGYSSFYYFSKKDFT